jgi:hypothetical protein
MQSIHVEKRLAREMAPIASSGRLVDDADARRSAVFDNVGSKR